MSARHWLTVNNRADNEPVEILIQGQIGKNWWDDSGTSEKEFTDALAAIPEDRNIIVGINSEGGSVKDGLGIYNALLRLGDRVSTRIDGWAVSIASVIALAGSKRISPKSSVWMIHEPWASAQGNSEDMLKAAEMLEKHGQVIADIYAERTGMKVEDARDKMRAETWFKGDEAVAMGFATESNDEPVALNSFDPKKFRNIPTDILAAAVNTDTQSSQSIKPVTTPAPSLSNPKEGEESAGIAACSTNQTKENKMSEPTPAPAAQPATEPNAPVALSPESVAAIGAAVSAAMKPADSALPPRVQNLGLAGVNAINEKSQGKDRRDFVRDNWNELRSGGVPMTPVYNANTTDYTALTTAMLSNQLIVVLQNRLAQLSAFTRDFGMDTYKPNAVIQVPIVTTGGTAQTNATSFEDTTNFVGTIDNVAITLARITVGAHLTPAELNNGFRMAQWSEIKANELADKIQSLVNAIITTTNFDRSAILGTSAVIKSATGFNIAGLNDMWEAIAKSSVKNAMLHQSYYKKFLPSTLENFNPLAANTLPGWDGFYLNTYWTGAEADTYGFACNPQAIAVGSGLPLASANRGMTTSVQTVSLPGIGLTVEQQQWYSTSTKSDWANWEVMFGAAKGDGSAGVLLKSQ